MSRGLGDVYKRQLVDRSKMPKDYETDMATLEEIIVFLSKGQEE